MTLDNAVYALEELAGGRRPDQSRALRGLNALDPILLRSGCAEEVYEAAALLELLVATGGTAEMLRVYRARAAAMAAAVRHFIT